MSETKRKISPVLKWAGGKRQLVTELVASMPNGYENYYEPFIGAGALLLEIQPRTAVVNDYNAELINVYQVIRDDVESLIVDLQTHENTPEYFYSMREKDRSKTVWDAMTDLEKASRTIYLNKTCYNGLYRVNSKGFFNTPFGRYKKPNICAENDLRALSEYLNTADIRIFCKDYKEAVKSAKSGDFVYFDPPYAPISKTAYHTAYTPNGFTDQNQIELCETCKELDAKGVLFMLSNSDTDFIKGLYRGFNISIVPAKRAINCKGNARSNVNEVIVRNYE